MHYCYSCGAEQKDGSTLISESDGNVCRGLWNEYCFECWDILKQKKRGMCFFCDKYPLGDKYVYRFYSKICYKCAPFRAAWRIAKELFRVKNDRRD